MKHFSKKMKAVILIDAFMWGIILVAIFDGMLGPYGSMAALSGYIIYCFWVRHPNHFISKKGMDGGMPVWRFMICLVGIVIAYAILKPFIGQLLPAGILITGIVAIFMWKGGIGGVRSVHLSQAAHSNSLWVTLLIIGFLIVDG